MLHYPPYYGQDKALASLELFATEVIPKLKSPAPKRGRHRAQTPSMSWPGHSRPKDGVASLAYVPAIPTPLVLWCP